MIAVKLAAIFFLLKCAFAEDDYEQYRGAPVEFDTKNIERGEYRYSFRTPENIERDESGGFDGEGNYFVNGYYSYFDEFGKKVYVQYIADKDGYRVIRPSQGMGAFAPANIVAALLG